MKRLTVSLIAVLFLIFARPHDVFSCDCFQDFEGAFGESETVFLGTVKKIQKTGKVSQFYEEEIIVSFDVAKSWKGPTQKELVLHTVYNRASCDGYWFEENKEYLVFAQRESDGTLGTSFCHRTTSADKAQEDLEKLGEGKTPS